MHKANWENKTNKVIEGKQIKRKYEQLQDQRRRFIDIRRKKLSELLIGEEESYRQEIISMQETPEQVRLKMEAKLKGMKEAREKERLEQVQKLQEQRFFESADELRKNESEAFAFSCYLEQENQMLDKLKKRQQERLEEEVFVKLNNYDNIKKIEKEKSQIEEKKKKEEETYKFLEWQRGNAERNAQKELENKTYEKIKLKEQWEKDLIREEEEKKGSEK
jgi:hypothetical protein